jgi:hypothetical protein
MNFGVVTYKDKVAETYIDLRTSPFEGFTKMRSNPAFILNATMLDGQVKLSSQNADIAIYLNGLLANNSFAISRGNGYITFVYQGSNEFLRNKFLLEIKIF